MRDAYGNKSVLDIDGVTLLAELALLVPSRGTGSQGESVFGDLLVPWIGISLLFQEMPLRTPPSFFCAPFLILRRGGTFLFSPSNFGF